MTCDEKIREVMRLVDNWARKDYEAGVACIDPWTENSPTTELRVVEKLYDEASSVCLALESKLRELLGTNQ